MIMICLGTACSNLCLALNRVHNMHLCMMHFWSVSNRDLSSVKYKLTVERFMGN